MIPWLILNCSRDVLVEGTLKAVSGLLGSCGFGGEEVLRCGPLLLVSDEEGGCCSG